MEGKVHQDQVYHPATGRQCALIRLLLQPAAVGQGAVPPILGESAARALGFPRDAYPSFYPREVTRAGQLPDASKHTVLPVAEVPNASPPAGLFYVDSQNEPLFSLLHDGDLQNAPRFTHIRNGVPLNPIRFTLIRRGWYLNLIHFPIHPRWGCLWGVFNTPLQQVQLQNAIHFGTLRDG